MGICYTKKTIEEIVQSKYTLAKDLNSKDKKNQFYHVYVWRYTSEDLALKDIKFYDSDKQFTNETNNKNSVENDDSQSEDPQFLQGQPLKWPIKAHADQGYIILTLKNNKIALQSLCQALQKPIQPGEKSSNSFRHRKVSLEMLEILYMIHLDSFRSYYFAEIQQENQKRHFQASIQIIVGDLLEKIDCLKLVTISYELQKYLKVGGQNSLKKFYNQFQNITYLNAQSLNCIQSFIPQRQTLGNKFLTDQLQKLPQNKQTFTSNQLEIERIVMTEIKRIQNSQIFETEEQKDMQIEKLFSNLYCNFSKFNFLKFSLLQGINLTFHQHKNHNQSQQNNNFLSNDITRPIIEKFSINQKDLQHEKINIVFTVSKKEAQNGVLLKQRQIRHHRIDDFENIGIENNDISIIQKPHGERNKKSDTRNEMLDTSSPFICQITQIGGLQQSFDEGMMNEKEVVLGKMEKKASKFSKKNEILHQNGEIEDSLFLPKELQELRIDRSLYKISSKLSDLPQSHLIVTTYAGSSQFQELEKQNVSLIINMSPSECYNYFIHDFSYKWYDLEPLHKILSEEQLFSQNFDAIGDQNLHLYNIECLILGIIEQIQTQIQRQKQGGSLRPNKVVIFCNHKNLIYSGTIAVAYLIFTNTLRLSFQQAYQAVRQSTNDKFRIPKIYEVQLKDLLSRIDQSSSTSNLNSLNTKSSSYRSYEIGLYNKNYLSFVVNRYIGQLSSSNQLQTLQNNTLKTFFLVPNNLTSIIMKTINIMREDNSLLNSENYPERLKNISKLVKNMGLSLRLFCGKEVTNQQKQSYLSFAKNKLISQLVRYVYMNFMKKIFNVQKYQAKLDLIIESLKELILLQSVEKSFRKPQPYEQHPLSLVTDIQLLKTTPLESIQGEIMPYNFRETLTFKYPILRPIFEGKRKDSYYFMIKKFQDKGEKKSNGMGCNVTFFKGQNWIGLEQDKQRYFQKIVEEYLSDVNEERIWIEDEDDSGGEKSLFDRDSMIF